MSLAQNNRTNFKRTITVVGQIGIALATISPVAGVFANIQGTLGTAGTGMLWAYLIATVITLGVAFTYGEMGSIYPVTGGLYSIVRNVLGPTLGFVALTDYLIQAVFIPATMALGAAQYFQSIMPSVPLNVIGFIVMLIVTLIALGPTTLEVKFTGFFVALELILMSVITISSILHIHQPLGIYGHPVAEVNKHIVGSTWTKVIAATAVALFSYNGYDSALNVSEETKASPKQIGSSVVKSAALAIIFQLIPIFFMLLATPSLPGLLNSDNPLATLGTSLLGSNAGTIFNIAAGIAILNSTLGVTIQFSRLLFASARDQVFPGMLNDWFTKIHPRTGAPYIAVSVIGLIGLVMTFFSTFLFDLTFIGVILVSLYILVTFSAIVSRFRDPKIERPFRTPFGLLFPAVGLVGSVAVLVQQTVNSIVTTFILFVVGALYWLIFGRRFTSKGGKVESNYQQMS
jgi:amino acid transporter